MKTTWKMPKEPHNKEVLEKKIKNKKEKHMVFEQL